MSYDGLAAFKLAQRLLDQDPSLGGLLALGERPQGVGRPIPPGAQLSSQRTMWGERPGLLDAGGTLYADLDLLSPAAQAYLAERLDKGGCTLIAWATEAPWAGIADRLGLIISLNQMLHLPEGPERVTQVEAHIELAGLAASWGVCGNRAEWLAWRAAKAAAALRSRRGAITRADLLLAAAFVLAPRATVAAEQTPPRKSQQNQSSRLQPQTHAPIVTTQAPPLPTPAVKPRPALHGTPVRPVARPTRRAGLDLVATLLAALPWQRLRGQAELPLAIRPADLRFWLRRPRQGRLLIFLVDSSGSMGARRLGQAKGAILSALSLAYRRRDQVALITAGLGEARLLLPPVRAVERARSELLALPAGGGTPLASALLLARGLAAKARLREGRPSVLIAMTDGRANLPHFPGANVPAELKQAALHWRRVGSAAVLFGEPGPTNQHLSRWLGVSLQPAGRNEFAPGRTTLL